MKALSLSTTDHQERLSSDLGMSREKLKAIETGKTINPGLADVVLISRYFMVPTDVLLTVDVSKLGELKIRILEAARTGEDTKVGH